MNGNGVMNWKINGCSGVSGSNGATDAELDVAMSLIIASEQWGSSYASTAKSFIQTIKKIFHFITLSSKFFHKLINTFSLHCVND